ncbi:mannose-1-phosphate guanylyltransferase (GDP) /mannose-6-phosphate isomerase, type 2 [Aquipseudomonas alcaligenes]|uniref:mannose-1-phosphate guanylyltransferase/mannose-6-phosphate isomerase n=1 Tax=Aquipseudomonas alcaligenes TaxID=43263 RepID=UPI000953A35C|nr:mannose-1-phosphate guanylyltransferase/mannose-6-phosphate isomerase [Pseudomonas alcaligenes]SIS13266.1 mannose-1-phosphate guanylyltransferase (GDP) /mannose-6-phosphate isomerase, type 2 [Pseudomonas alcaligenes]
MQIIPVVMSGGAGTRLWPVSREAHPKPFMRLPDGESLLGKTYARAAALLAGGGEIVTVTNRELYFASKDHFAEARTGHCCAHFLLEPEGRNTAPAIAIAALALAKRHAEEAVLVVMAADHLIQDVEAFRAATEQAVRLAAQGHLVTYGIPPTVPETGFGYIETGDMLDAQDARRVARFVEKPDLQTAQEYLRSGRFLWNSGMFCFSIGSILRELRAHAPELLQLADECVAASPAHDSAGVLLQELDARSFAELPDISIDYAVMERSSSVAVVPATFDWSDIGSWGALSQLIPADAEQNRVQGEAILIETRNTVVLGETRLVATVGLDNLIIVDTADAVLVAHADRAQEVRQVAKRLKAQSHDAYRLHRTVARPWGTYTVLEEGPRFKIKRIVVKPGGSLSLQMHHHRSEHWIVVSGMAKVVNGEGEMMVNTNESTFIPAGHKHRLENPGVIDLVMIEVQSGEYLGEDDIVRFVDNYGRIPA